jgi:predicted DsbA family dithiol-disulfide isomerase
MDLLTAYHQSGFPPSDRPTLADIAVKHGVFPSRDDALRFLKSDECDAAVRRAYVIPNRLGITGVPFFVFQDRYAARGAMGVDEFVRVSDDSPE